jgi:hypothetical protein
MALDDQNLSCREGRQGCGPDSAISTVCRVAVIAYWIVLTAGLLWPYAGHLGGLAKPVIGGTDDLAHFLAFLVLGLSVHFARLLPNRAYLGGSLLVYALVTEIGQTLSPGRTPNIGGAAANVLGIVTALGIVWAARHVVDRLRADKTPRKPDLRSHTPE